MSVGVEVDGADGELAVLASDVEVGGHVGFCVGQGFGISFFLVVVLWGLKLDCVVEGWCDA